MQWNIVGLYKELKYWHMLQHGWPSNNYAQ
jgi:hypothetical protein